jgi:integrase
VRPDLVTPFELYERKPGGNWWMRFSIKGQRQVRIGLKTADKAAAQARAAKEHLRYQLRAEEGQFTAPAKFKKLAQRYLENLDAEVKIGLKKEYRGQSDRHVIERYLIPFFGDYRVDQITTRLVRSFIDWRYVYWTEGPGKDIERLEYQRNGRRVFQRINRSVPAANTVRANCAVLSNVLKFAELQGEINSGDIPRIPLPKVKPNPRPTFSLKEVHHLIVAAGNRVGTPQLTRRQRYERLVLASYIDIAAHTGLRPVELHNLEWRHVSGFDSEGSVGENDDIVLHAFGKTKPRNVIAMGLIGGSLQNLWQSYTEMHGTRPKRTTPLFCNYRGERIRSFKKSLNALLDAEGMKEHQFGGVRVAYSFRHFYISQQILAGVDIFKIAINAGTSVEMIEKFYAKLGPELFKKELRPNWVG